MLDKHLTKNISKPHTANLKSSLDPQSQFRHHKFQSTTEPSKTMYRYHNKRKQTAYEARIN
jgi:hypothetical protein